MGADEQAQARRNDPALEVSGMLRSVSGGNRHSALTAVKQGSYWGGLSHDIDGERILNRNGTIANAFWRKVARAWADYFDRCYTTTYGQPRPTVYNLRPELAYELRLLQSPAWGLLMEDNRGIRQRWLDDALCVESNADRPEPKPYPSWTDIGGTSTVISAHCGNDEAHDPHLYPYFHDDQPHAQTGKCEGTQAATQERFCGSYKEHKAHGFKVQMDPMEQSTRYECMGWPFYETPDPVSTTGQAVDPAGIAHPAHYNQHPSGVECITIVQHHNFNVGSAIKYLWRQGLKDGEPDIKDLRKAIEYIGFEIARLEK